MTLSIEPPDAAAEHTVREAVSEARVSADAVQEGHVCTRCWQVAPPGDPAACATCNAPRPADGWAQMPYRLNDRYRFNRLLGRGAQGAVFLALDLQSPLDARRRGVARAIKVVQNIAGTALDRERAMFEHEAAAGALLGRSPAFVRIYGYDAGTDPYLVMECVEWPTLAKALRAGPLSSVQAARLGVAMLEAIEIMHYHRMVHRDLKPSNLFADESNGEWRVKIADLGIWIRDHDAPAPASMTTDDRIIHGTVPYMSPEQMNGNRLGPRSDLHTVASILWECVTGSVPFPVDPDVEPAGQVAARRQAVRALPPQPAAMNDALYDALAPALAYTPDARPATARALIDALRDVIDDTVLDDWPATIRRERRVLVDRLATLRARGLDDELRRRADAVERALDTLSSHLGRDGLTHRGARKMLAAARADLVALAAAADDPYRQADVADPTANEDRRKPASTLPPTAPITPPTGVPAVAAPSADPLRRYAVVELVGAGSTARIYHATQRTLDRRIALRIMHAAGFAGLGLDAAAFFRARARAAARLRHPHIVSVYDHDTGADGLPYVVEPLLTGPSLLTHLKERRTLDPAEVIALAHPLASALAAAHASGVIHQNLKPENIHLETPAGLGIQPVVHGFGFDLAEIDDLLAGGRFYGTPAYAAPEQVDGRYGPAADVYALGTIVFRLVTGLLPFWGQTVDAVLALKQTDPAPALPTHTARRLVVPDTLRALVAAMLATDPAARPDAAAVSATLRTLEGTS